MSYIVVYQRADGSSGLEECTDLDLAVVAAERLRNVDSVESPRILKTEEIHFDFRPYYRVEVAVEPVQSAPVVAPAASLDEPLDPWAQTSLSSVESVEHAEPATDPPVSEPDAASAAGEPDPMPEPAPVPEAAEESVPAEPSEIFSTENLPDPPQEFPAVGQLAEDVSDAVPPRRGLFGR